MNPEDDIEVAGGSEQGGGAEDEAGGSRHHPAINVKVVLGSSPVLFSRFAEDSTKRKRDQKERERGAAKGEVCAIPPGNNPWRRSRSWTEIISSTRKCLPMSKTCASFQTCAQKDLEGELETL